MEIINNALELMNLLKQEFKGHIRNVELIMPITHQPETSIRGILYGKEFEIKTDFSASKPEISSISYARFVNDMLTNFLNKAIDSEPLYSYEAQVSKNLIFSSCWNSKKLLEALKNGNLDDLTFRKIALADFNSNVKILSFSSNYEKNNDLTQNDFDPISSFEAFDLFFSDEANQKINIISFEPNSDKTTYTTDEFEMLKRAKKVVELKYTEQYNKPHFYVINSSLYTLNIDSKSEKTIRKISDLEFTEGIFMYHKIINVYYDKSDNNSAGMITRDLHSDDTLKLKQQIQNIKALKTTNSPNVKTAQAIQLRQPYEMADNEIKIYKVPESNGPASYSKDYYMKNLDLPTPNSIIQKLDHPVNLSYPRMLKINSKTGFDYYIFNSDSFGNDDYIRKIEKLQLTKDGGDALVSFYLKPLSTDINSNVITKEINDSYYINYFLQMIKKENFTFIDSLGAEVKKEVPIKNNQSNKEKI
ncbi:MAG: hypothetical protein PHR96_01060 [Clostridia bacterium]|nr:hypothetical protein [Clostridia bacterium]